MEGRHFAVYLFVHTKHSRKAGPLSVARLTMDLPFHSRLACNFTGGSASPLTAALRLGSVPLYGPLYGPLKPPGFWRGLPCPAPKRWHAARSDRLASSLWPQVASLDSGGGCRRCGPETYPLTRSVHTAVPAPRTAVHPMGSIPTHLRCHSPNHVFSFCFKQGF